MKRIIIPIAAMMLWASCVAPDSKEEDPTPEDKTIVDNNNGNGNQNQSNDNGNGNGNNNGQAGTTDNGNNKDDGKMQIDAYVPDTNFASEAERKAADLVDNSIKKTIEILGECQYPKTYTLTVAKYDKEPARESLDDITKEVYDSLYHCALRYEPFHYDGSRFDEGKNPVTDKFFASVFLGAYDALRKDFPELTQFFAMDFLESSRSDIYTEWIKPGGHGNSSSDKESTIEYREVFDAAIDRIIKAMPKNLCDFDKYRYIATFVCIHNTYDQSKKTVGAYWPCYNVIINKTSVCSGYAATFQYLCRKAGLWCEKNDGTQEGGDHAWNKIMIDGKTYLCDCTFADSYSPNTFDWMRHFVQGEYEREYIGEYLDMDGKPFQTTGAKGTDLWE